PPKQPDTRFAVTICCHRVWCRKYACRHSGYCRGKQPPMKLSDEPRGTAPYWSRSRRPDCMRTRGPRPEYSPRVGRLAQTELCTDQPPFRPAGFAHPTLSTRQEVLGAETDDDRVPYPPKPAVTPGSSRAIAVWLNRPTAQDRLLPR